MDFSENNILTFFAVLVRISVFFAIMPIFGDRNVSAMLKVLLSLSVSMILYPILVSKGSIVPEDAAIWSKTVYGLVKVVTLEAAFGLVLGFVSKLIFEFVQMGGDVIGNFMGLASASQFDPHQESQTQVVAKFYLTLATLLFIAIDGHHMLITSIARSYDIVSLGSATFGGALTEKLTDFSSGLIRTGLQLGAPMAVCFFAINVVYGIIAKSTPQINILVLSFSISALIGMFVMYTSFPEFVHVTREMFVGLEFELFEVMKTLK